MSRKQDLVRTCWKGISTLILCRCIVEQRARRAPEDVLFVDDNLHEIIRNLAPRRSKMLHRLYWVKHRRNVTLRLDWLYGRKFTLVVEGDTPDDAMEKMIRRILDDDYELPGA